MVLCNNNNLNGESVKDAEIAKLKKANTELSNLCEAQKILLGKFEHEKQTTLNEVVKLVS